MERKYFYKIVSNHKLLHINVLEYKMMKQLVFIIIILVFENVYGQTESIKKINVNLFDYNMISDGISRYSKPKISPDGKKVLTSKNRDTLIYIDIELDTEKVLLAGGQFFTYYWIDSNTIYLQKEMKLNL
jgi:hypothetical protein